MASAEITRIELLRGTESYRLGSSHSDIRISSQFPNKSRSHRELSTGTAKLVQSNDGVFGNEMLVANTSIVFPGRHHLGAQKIGVREVERLKTSDNEGQSLMPMQGVLVASY